METIHDKFQVCRFCCRNAAFYQILYFRNSPLKLILMSLPREQSSTTHEMINDKFQIEFIVQNDIAPFLLLSWHPFEDNF